MAFSANQVCILRNPTQQRRLQFVFASKKKFADFLMSEMQPLVFEKRLFVFPESQISSSFFTKSVQNTCMPETFWRNVNAKKSLADRFLLIESMTTEFQINLLKKIESVYQDQWNNFGLFDILLASNSAEPKTILDSWLATYKSKDVNWDNNWRNIACSLVLISEKSQSSEHFLVNSIHKGSNARTRIQDIVAEGYLTSNGAVYVFHCFIQPLYNSSNCANFIQIVVFLELFSIFLLIWGRFYNYSLVDLRLLRPQFWAAETK